MGAFVLLLIKPYRRMCRISIRDEHLAKLQYVYATVHSISLFTLVMIYTGLAYVYDPSHMLMLKHWFPYLVFVVIYILFVLVIDIIVAHMFHDGGEFFDGVLAGFSDNQNIFKRSMN